MMKKYSGIIFDFDDTLVAVREFAYNYTKHFLKKHNINTHLSPDLYFQKVQNSESDLPKNLEKSFWKDYIENEPQEIELFTGVKNLLNKVREDFNLGIVIW